MQGDGPHRAFHDFLQGHEDVALDIGKDATAEQKAEMIDLGDITNARGTEQLLPIWVRLYGALQSPMFNFKIVMGPEVKG